MSDSAVLHLVFFDLKVASPDEAEFVLVELQRLSAIDGVVSLITARTLRADASHALVSLVYLRDRSALEAYGLAATHQVYAGEVFLPAVGEVVVGDFEVGGAPPALAPVIHPFFVSFRDGVSEAAVGAFCDALRSLTAIPSVRAVHVGRSIDAAAAYPVGGCVFFDSAAGLDAYANHPLHAAFVGEHWTPLVADARTMVATANSPPAAPSDPSGEEAASWQRPRGWVPGNRSDRAQEERTRWP